VSAVNTDISKVTENIFTRLKRKQGNLRFMERTLTYIQTRHSVIVHRSL